MWDWEHVTGTRDCIQAETLAQEWEARATVGLCTVSLWRFQ